MKAVGAVVPSVGTTLLVANYTGAVNKSIFLPNIIPELFMQSGTSTNQM